MLGTLYRTDRGPRFEVQKHNDTTLLVLTDTIERRVQFFLTKCIHYSSIKDITNSDGAKHRRTSSSEQIECQCKLQNQCDDKFSV